MTNQEVGELIGLSHSAVSRIRSGQRFPGLNVMLTISQQFDWPLDDQMQARRHSVNYAAEFDRRVNEKATTR
jgi:transcriptional regulator with XRE-family HTH domain